MPVVICRRSVFSDIRDWFGGICLVPPSPLPCAGKSLLGEERRELRRERRAGFRTRHVEREAFAAFLGQRLDHLAHAQPVENHIRRKRGRRCPEPALSTRRPKPHIILSGHYEVADELLAVHCANGELCLSPFVCGRHDAVCKDLMPSTAAPREKAGVARGKRRGVERGDSVWVARDSNSQRIGPETELDLVDITRRRSERGVRGKSRRRTQHQRQNNEAPHNGTPFYRRMMTKAFLP